MDKKQNIELFESILDGVWCLDLINPANSYLNNRFWLILGYKNPPKFSKGDSWISLLHPDDKESFLGLFQGSELHTLFPKFDTTVRFVTDTKTVVWISLKGKGLENGNNFTLMGYATVVTNQIESERRLENKITHFKNVIRGGNFAIWEVNYETKFIRLNKRYAQIIGYTLEELEPLTISKWLELVHPLDKQYILDTFYKLVTDKTTFEIEFRLQHKSGKWIWILSSGGIIELNENGGLTLFSGFLFDITERKNNELLILNNSATIKRINVLAKIGKWEFFLDPGKKLVHTKSTCDPYIKELLGFSLDDSPTFQELSNFFVEDMDRWNYYDLVKKAVKEGEEFEVIVRLVCQPNNEIKWIRVIALSEFENGFCKRIYGFFQDVDKETKTSKALEVKEEELRHTFDQASVGMVFRSVKENSVRINQAAANIYGYSFNELKNFKYGDITHPEDYERGQVFYNEILEGKKESGNLEYRVIHKSGRIIWVNLTISAIKNEEGKLLHMLLQTQDITKKKELSENLKEHNTRLLNFAHIVSHNLRSHASNIAMLLDLMATEYPDILNNSFMKNIKVVSDNMNDTIYHLNEIVEINAKVNTKLLPHKIKKHIDQTIQHLHPILQESKANVIVNVSSKIVVQVVVAYLESIILNLLTNAVKYRDSKRSLVINIEAVETWDEVVLTVEDNGLGIDLEKYGKKIFGLYKVFHDHKDSNGVGLFLIKNQIEAMGGKIEVSSTPNKGTKFITYFKKPE